MHNSSTWHRAHQSRGIPQGFQMVQIPSVRKNVLNILYILACNLILFFSILSGLNHCTKVNEKLLKSVTK